MLTRLILMLALLFGAPTTLFYMALLILWWLGIYHG